MLSPSIFSSATYAMATSGGASCAAPGGPATVWQRRAPPCNALVERPQLVFVVRVVEAEHRHHVLDRLEALDGTPSYTLCRRVAGDELGMFRLEALELVQEAIELLVGDLGIVVDVVTLFVMTDRVAESVNSFFYTHRQATKSRKHETPHTNSSVSSVFVSACSSSRHRAIGRAVQRWTEQLAGDLRDHAIGRQSEQHETDEPQRAGS